MGENGRGPGHQIGGALSQSSIKMTKTSDRRMAKRVASPLLLNSAIEENPDERNPDIGTPGMSVT